MAVISEMLSALSTMETCKSIAHITVECHNITAAESEYDLVNGPIFEFIKY